MGPELELDAVSGSVSRRVSSSLSCCQLVSRCFDRKKS